MFKGRFRVLECRRPGAGQDSKSAPESRFSVVGVEFRTTGGLGLEVHHRNSMFGGGFQCRIVGSPGQVKTRSRNSIFSSDFKFQTVVGGLGHTKLRA